MAARSAPDHYRVVGWDQSPTHAGVVVLDEMQRLLWVRYVTTKVGDAKGKNSPGAVAPAEIRSCKDRTQRDLWRLAWIATWIQSVVDSLAETNRQEPVYVALEDYAYHAPQGSHQAGESGGLVRLAVLRAGLKLRLHDPSTVKLATTGNGAADKEAVVAAVTARSGLDFTRYGSATEDLADAWALARILWLEIELRSGRLSLDALPESERRVFLRVTKRHPVNVLDRDFGVRLDPA